MHTKKSNVIQYDDSYYQSQILSLASGSQPFLLVGVDIVDRFEEVALKMGFTAADFEIEPTLTKQFYEVKMNRAIASASESIKERVG